MREIFGPAKNRHNFQDVSSLF